MNANRKSLQESWREYRDRCYPQGLFGVQNQETHQAFFAGALIALSEMSDLSTLPEDEAVARLQALFTEATQVCEARARELVRRVGPGPGREGD